MRRLVVAYLQQPLPMLLSDLVGTHDRAFTLLEGRQRPEQTRDLYLVLLAELAPAIELIEAATGRSTHSPLPVLR